MKLCSICDLESNVMEHMTDQQCKKCIVPVRYIDVYMYFTHLVSISVENAADTRCGRWNTCLVLFKFLLVSNACERHVNGYKQKTQLTADSGNQRVSPDIHFIVIYLKCIHIRSHVHAFIGHVSSEAIPYEALHVLRIDTIDFCLSGYRQLRVGKILNRLILL